MHKTYKQKIILLIKAKTCFISQDRNYRPQKYVYLNFKSEMQMEAAKKGQYKLNS